MIYNETTALKTAEYLLNINAINLQPEDPFTWASGWKSPIYCDNRLALSYPEVRTFLAETIANQIKDLYGTDVTIAGVATGAIGIGALVAQALDVPFVYVRPEPKKHGRQNQIEGYLNPDKKVVVVEDLISTGMSSLNAVNALKEENADVLGMIALFTYGFEKAQTNFSSAGIPLYTLSDYDHLLAFATQTKAISEEQQATLKSWRTAPSEWGR